MVTFHPNDSWMIRIAGYHCNMRETCKNYLCMPNRKKKKISKSWRQELKRIRRYFLEWRSLFRSVLHSDNTVHILVEQQYFHIKIMRTAHRYQCRYSNLRCFLCYIQHCTTDCNFSAEQEMTAFDSDYQIQIMAYSSVIQYICYFNQLSYVSS